MTLGKEHRGKFLLSWSRPRSSVQPLPSVEQPTPAPGLSLLPAGAAVPRLPGALHLLLFRELPAHLVVEHNPAPNRGFDGQPLHRLQLGIPVAGEYLNVQIGFLILHH